MNQKRKTREIVIWRHKGMWRGGYSDSDTLADNYVDDYPEVFIESTDFNDVVETVQSRLKADVV